VTHPRKPFSPNQRKILDAMTDGEPHWAEQLYQQLSMPRRNSATAVLYWLCKYGYLRQKPTAVVIGPDRTDEVYVITGKGRTAAANLDYGYDMLDPGDTKGRSNPSFHVGVKAVIVQDGKMLVARDRKNGYWDLIGGRIDAVDKTIEDTLRREIAEELPGVTDVQIGDIAGSVIVSSGIFQDDGVGLVLVMYLVTATIPPTLGDEHTESQWVTIAEARNGMGFIVAEAGRFLTDRSNTSS